MFALAPNNTAVSDESWLKVAMGLYKPEELYFATRYVPIVTHFAWLRLLNGFNYLQMLIPSQRSCNGVPALPFALSAFILGPYPIIAYMALQSTERYPQQIPPPKSALIGPANMLSRLLESNILPVATIALAALSYVTIASDCLVPLPEANPEFANSTSSALVDGAVTVKAVTRN